MSENQEEHKPEQGVPTYKSLRDRRRRLGLDPNPNPKPQLVLSRRERRKVAIAQAKASRRATIAAQGLPPASVPVLGSPTAPVLDLDAMKLGDIRKLAQERKVRVDGKRPSLCTKQELIKALSA